MTTFWWYLFKYVLIGPWLHLFFRPRIVEGAEHIPAKGPAILASNHLSFTDSLFMPLLMPRRVTFVAKAEYFTGTGLKGWFSRWFFTSVGQIPIDRSSGSAAKGALEAAKRVLAEGRLFGIYPEGTRSPDGRLYRGKTGIARIALEAGVPVIPMVMINTDKVLPQGKVLPRIHRVGVRIGKPLDFSRYQGMAGDRFVERSMTDEIMYELMLLSGQEYVDVYATKVKNALANGRTLDEATGRASVAAAQQGERASAKQAS